MTWMYWIRFKNQIKFDKILFNQYNISSFICIKSAMSTEILGSSKEFGLEETLNGFKNEEKNLKNVIESQNDVKKFWWISLQKNWEYNVPWISKSAKMTNHREFGRSFIDCRLTKWLWSVVFSDSLVIPKNWPQRRESHKETFYSQKRLPWWALEIPWRHVASDGTIRDKDWYIVVAANYIPKWSQIMTTLWPGKVYDVWWMKWKWIDIYVNW